MAADVRFSLRALLAGSEITVLPGVYDGFSARVVAAAGYPAAFVSGSGVSESRLALPDLGYLSFPDVRDAVASIAGAVPTALLVDIDTGFGGALQVDRVVREIEQLGAGGIVIEDQVAPKRCGYLPGRDVVSEEEMTEKIMAATAARRKAEFVIVARTDAYGSLGESAAVRRLQLYAAAGADLVFPEGFAGAEEIQRVCRESPVPVMLNDGLGLRARAEGATARPSVRELAALGVRVVLVPRLLSAAAVRGMRSAISAYAAILDSECTVDQPDLQVSFQDLLTLMGYEEADEHRRFDRQV